MRPVAVALAWALTCATALAAPPGSARALMERHQTHHFHDGGHRCTDHHDHHDHRCLDERHHDRRHRGAD